MVSKVRIFSKKCSKNKAIRRYAEVGCGFRLSSAVNAGKVYVTQNLLNINYASWIGLAWNGFHALKWALLQRHLKLWDGIAEQEIDSIRKVANNLDQLMAKAVQLPV